MIELGLNIVLIALSALTLLTLILLFLMIRSLMREFYSFMSPPPEGEEPSGIMSLVSEVGRASGRAIAMEVKTTAMGKASGEARLEKAIEGDIAQDTLNSKNPLIGGLLDMYPSLKKRALKNPGVVEFLLQRLGSAKAFNPPDNGESGFAERLLKYK